MSSKVDHEELVGWLTRSQGWLYGYVLTLLPNREAARDVLQQVNLVIWRKADTFDPSRSFLGWAASIAHFQVQAYLRDRRRDRHRFDETLLNSLAREAEAVPEEDPSDREVALRRCLDKLPAKDRELVLARYRPDASVQALAEQFQKTANAISRSLYRIRGLLGTCIERASGRPA